MVKLDGYEIFAEIHRSPWIAVYKAFDSIQKQTVVIKATLGSETPAAISEQINAETALRDRVDHPNLRRVLDAGKVRHQQYLILQYIEGPTLADIISPGLPIEICAWIIRELASALAALHSCGILHRDLKPSNIFLSTAGEVKLGDLGLAVAISELNEIVAGTPAYLSPEAVLGEDITARSDLFSLGAVFYELLTGEPPFADRTTSGILHRIANLHPTAIEKLRTEIPAELSSLCHRLLAKNPEDRIESAGKVIDQLDRFERSHGVRLTNDDLARFLAAPKAYRHIEFQRNGTSETKSQPVLEGLQPISAWKFNLRLRYLIPAFTLAGLLFIVFIWGAKENREPGPNLMNATGEDRPANTFGTRDSLARLESHRPPFVESSNAESLVTHSAVDRRQSLDAFKKTEGVEILAPLALDPDKATDHESSRSMATEEKLESIHSVLILSRPQALVTIEEDSIGMTPVMWHTSEPERVYKVDLAAPNLPAVSKLVVLAALESDTLLVDMNSEFGHLEVIVNPWGEIWVDDRPFDTSPLALPIPLSPGVHEISVRHPQLGIQTQRIVIASGDTSKLRFDLFSSQFFNANR